jgi:DNA-binding XRE family transcriptional regulator
MSYYRDKVIEFRKKRNLTQQELADLCGVCRATISNIENGRYKHAMYVLTQSKIDSVLNEEENKNAECEN